MKDNKQTISSDLDFLYEAMRKKMAKFDNDTRASKFFESGMIEGWHIHKEYLESLKRK